MTGAIPAALQPPGTGPATDVAAFIRVTAWETMPDAVRAQARRCLLDLLGTVAAGAETVLSRIVRDHAATHHAAGGTAGARLLFDGRRCSIPAAAFAGASTIDAFDAHDGLAIAKGHAGVAVLPALLAFADAADGLSGAELLATLVVGYEIALRAGVALHATATDYHSSGAWNAFGAAAVGARLLGLEGARIRHALGIAEYHAPRGPMMRCIDTPTMVKDGSGQGAMAGADAVLLAAAGYTGAPAALIDGAAAAPIWSDLGGRWLILEQYFKPWPVCRWAQPAVEAAFALLQDHTFDAADIADIEVVTFAEAARLAVRAPRSTEEAQYSLPFPLAATLVRGRLGAREVTDEGLADAPILDLAARIRMTTTREYDARFPAERWAEVRLRLSDGRILASGPVRERGNPEAPLSDETLREKFRELAAPLLGKGRADVVEAAVDGLADAPDARPFLDAVLEVQA